MKQKKSLLAVSLVFALVFSGFVSPIGVQAKGIRNESPKKYIKNKNATPFLTNKEKTKYKGMSRIFKKRRENPLQKIDTATPWDYIKYNKKKPASTTVCSKAMYKTLSPKSKRKVRQIEKKLRAQLQAALLSNQFVKLDEHSAWHSCPTAVVACRIANAENQKLCKYNKKARKINKKRYKTAKKRWKKRHKRGKIRYKKMKIKKYLDAKNICKNADVNSFDIDYNVTENVDMPVHDSAQTKLSWNAKKGGTAYHVVKVEEEFKTEKINKEETTVNTASYEDPKKYTPDSLFDNAPSVYFVYTHKKGSNKINIYKQNFEQDFACDLTDKLAKLNREEYKKTGVCEGINYFTLLELNRLRNSVGLDSLEYSAEMNKYAQIRATEVSKKFSHERLDGSSYDTAYPKTKCVRFPDELKNNSHKWFLNNEGCGSWKQASGLWSSEGHRKQLSLEISTHAAIGNYYNFTVITPITTGEKGIEKIIQNEKKWEEWEKNKETLAREALAKCGINFDDHLNELDEIYQMLVPFGKPFADPELIKQVYYKGMPLWVYYEIIREIDEREEAETGHAESAKIRNEVWQKWIEKHKKYKE